jgi:hypothetical protein
METTWEHRKKAQKNPFPLFPPPPSKEKNWNLDLNMGF